MSPKRKASSKEYENKAKKRQRIMKKEEIKKLFLALIENSTRIGSRKKIKELLEELESK